MKTVGDHRRENLELLVREFKKLEEVARLGATTSVYLSQVRNRTPDAKTGRPREMGPSMARRLEKACGKPVGWMDQANGAEQLTIFEPPSPPAGYKDRHDVSDSDWALLNDIKDAMANPALAHKVEAIRTELAGLQAWARRVYEQRVESAGAGGHLGGLSSFGELDDTKPAEKKKADGK